MIDTTNVLLFLAAALVIAVTPGPGIFYVAARALAGGRREGIASSVGTGIGGMVHVVAGAVGVSALVLASAEAFAALKLLGAVYLIWLGVRTIRSAGAAAMPGKVRATGERAALRQGIVVEALNPKTAAFFLAFIPQFVDPSQGSVALQFVALGSISVLLNTGADVVVACWAAAVRSRLAARPVILRRLRMASGATMVGLGALLAVARRPA